MRLARPARLASLCLLAGAAHLCAADNAPANGASPAPAVAVQSGPWQNPALSPTQRAALLLAQMTQAEKLKLVIGHFGSDFDPKGTKKHAQALPHSAGFVEGVPRLGIPAQYETDAGIGVATQGTGQAAQRERTALPSGLATAATWNPELAFQGGAMIGAEARASGFNVMLAGGVNLVREPRNGRNFEYAGEDPLLAGSMVGQHIKGIQSNHIVSTLKHFALNAQETGRFVLDARIDQASARMSDLLAMQFALEQGQPGAVMCAYNRFNGAYACENPWLLNQVLKQDWGFAGYVMSDWGAVHSTVAASQSGLDQESGWEFDAVPYFGGPLREAVENGAVPQTRLDDMVRRILFALYASGVMDHPVVTGGTIDHVDQAAHAQISRSAAEEAIVLLKNRQNLLPLSPGKGTSNGKGTGTGTGTGTGKIVVIGAHADVGVLSGGGSSQVYPIGGVAVRGLEPSSWPGPVVYFPSSPLAQIRALALDANVSYHDGRDPQAAAQLAAGADVVIVFAEQWIGEANDATSLALPNQQDALIASVAAANPNTVVVLETGGPVTMPWLDQVGAVLAAWYPGTSGGEAIARVLFGVVNPSGHLPVSFPQSESQLPRPQLDGDRKHEDQRFTVNYHEGAAVGYKWYDAKGIKPLFPFGFGLSYTDFDYDKLHAEYRNGVLRVRFTVSNRGNMAGQAVPQVYLAPVAKGRQGGWEAPKRLVGWRKVALVAGQAAQVELAVDSRLLGVFDERSRRWKIAPGQYQVLLAQHAGDDGASRTSVLLPARVLDVRGKAIR
jgi:beta-glucosidase